MSSRGVLEGRTRARSGGARAAFAAALIASGSASCCAPETPSARAPATATASATPPLATSPGPAAAIDGDEAGAASRENLALRARFVAESVDPGWAPQAERTARDAVDRAGGAGATVTCRSTMCEIRLPIDDEEAGRFLMVLMRDRALSPVFASLRNTGSAARADGVAEAVWYLKRVDARARPLDEPP